MSAPKWVAAVGDSARKSVAAFAGKTPILIAWVYASGHGGFCGDGIAVKNRAEAIKALRCYADFLESKPPEQE